MRIWGALIGITAILLAIGLGIMLAQFTVQPASANDTLSVWDLVAQNLMAVGTLAIVSLTGMGLYYLRGTYLEAQKTVAETKRIGEAQTRCYLVFDKVELDWTDYDIPDLYITIQNLGNTPAREVQIRGEIFFYSNDRGINFPLDTHEYQFNLQPANISGSRTEKIKLKYWLLLEEYTEISDVLLSQNVHNVVVRMDVHCNDVFNYGISGSYYGNTIRPNEKLQRGRTTMFTGIRIVHPQVAGE